jgi:hypothetical protein
MMDEARGGEGGGARRLEELLALAANDLGSLREAIDELDREDAGELLLAAVLRVVSLEAAVSFAAETGEHESPSADAEELPVDDPWVDPDRPHSSMLDAARQLRMALLDQPTLASTLAALGALSPDENALIVLEYAVDAFWTRSLEGGAGGERGDGGDG